MLKGEVVGIIVLAFMSTGSWCYFSYANVNLKMICDEFLVVVVFNRLVLLVAFMSTQLWHDLVEVIWTLSRDGYKAWYDVLSQANDVATYIGVTYVGGASTDVLGSWMT